MDMTAAAIGMIALKTIAGPGGVLLDLDPRVTYPVPRPAQLPFVAAGKATLRELAEKGQKVWYDTAVLDGYPFVVPAEIADFYLKQRPGFLRDGLMNFASWFTRAGLIHMPGDEFPRGVARMRDRQLITQTCSACHSGMVNGKLIAGVNNKWYNHNVVIDNVGLAMRASLPMLRAEGAIAADVLARTEAELAKLERYQGVIGKYCDDIGPGQITTTRIWAISTKLLTEPSQLVTAEGRKRFPCGVAKAPPLNTVRFRNLLFWDGSVNAQWVAHWPMFDFYGYDACTNGYNMCKRATKP